jgi:hypothetical protein
MGEILGNLHTSLHLEQIHQDLAGLPLVLQAFDIYRVAVSSQDGFLGSRTVSEHNPSLGIVNPFLTNKVPT